LTIRDINFDRIDLNSRLANLFTFFYFDLGKNTNKYIKSAPFKVKKCGLNHSSSTAATEEKIKVFKTYDIDAILGGSYQKQLVRLFLVDFRST
jgi:hypothetical protein